MFSPGNYWVGDLRYLLNDDDWDHVRAIIDLKRFGEHALPDGKRFAIYSTVFGEGVFCDNFDREYYTDTGTIGCIELLNPVATPTLGHFLRFRQPFQTGYLDDSECIIFFGDVEINTVFVEN